MTVPENALLCGRYRLQDSIGRGGMADVYLAFDETRQAHVAVKILREDMAEDPDFVRRFRREGEALARLDHPNIVRFYAFEQDGPTAFIVMDYIEGTTLRRYLHDRRGPLPLDEITRLLRDVCAALHYAHLNGFVHRDLKPGNIMLKPNGRALLTDFGISRALEGATLTGAAMGTPAYMSPEQITGAQVDPRSDIYSLGVMLFEMTTGRRPFTGEEPGLTTTGTTTRLQQAHLRLPAPDPRTLNPVLPPDAAKVILRALAKQPADRWLDVVTLRQAWEAATGVASPASDSRVHPGPSRGPKAQTPAHPSARSRPESGRRPIVGWIAALAGVAVLSFAAALALQPRPPADERGVTPPPVAASATATQSVDPTATRALAQRSGGVVQLATAPATVPPPTDAPAASAQPTPTMLPTPTSPPTETATPVTPTPVVGRVVIGSDLNGYAHIFTLLGNGQGLRAITGGSEYFWNPVLSDDGALVAYVSKVNGNTEVFVARSDGRNARPISNHPAEDDHPAWFPGDGAVAFASRRGGGWDIYRANADGSNVQPLTADGGDNRFVSVSPDGSRIVYVAQNASYPNIDLMIMNADGGGRRALYTYASGKQRDDPGRYLYRPDWSPDGTRIAFGADDDNDGLISVLIIDAGSGQAQRLLGDGNGPAWSPDGSRLIYKPAGERQLLFVADLAGNRLYQLTASSYNAWSPDWAR